MLLTLLFLSYSTSTQTSKYMQNRITPYHPTTASLLQATALWPVLCSFKGCPPSPLCQSLPHSAARETVGQGTPGGNAYSAQLPTYPPRHSMSLIINPIASCGLPGSCALAPAAAPTSLPSFLLPSLQSHWAAFLSSDRPSVLPPQGLPQLLSPQPGNLLTSNIHIILSINHASFQFS